MRSLRCLFVSDLHGAVDRYQKLFAVIEQEQPAAVLLGGDLLPSRQAHAGCFINDVLVDGLDRLRQRLGRLYPQVFLILGNDDGRSAEQELQATGEGRWHYAHGQTLSLDRYTVIGYSYIPPTPFQLKDWERYDVSRYVDVGCVSPERGYRSVPVAADEIRFATIAADLAELGSDDLGRTIFLFHSPPYQSKLDRAALDGQMVDHAPLDVNVGSIAIRRMIEQRQPLLTLHGHIHESTRLTGSWRDRFGHTHAFTAAHDGPELALIRFDPADLEHASRELV